MVSNGGAGVWNALALALVVFIPKGARFFGPTHPNTSEFQLRSCDDCSHTHRSGKGILLEPSIFLGCSDDVLETLALRLQTRLLSSKAQCIVLVIERYFEWRFGRFVAWRLRLELSRALIQWLRSGSRLVGMHQVLLAPCRKHLDTYVMLLIRWDYRLSLNG